MKKRIVFIGCRFMVLEKLMSSESENIIKIFSLENSFLSNELDKRKILYQSFNLSNKNEILELLHNLDFDILISNGCPIIFPVKNFNNSKIFINIHPTHLPDLKGKTPLNGVFYLNYNYYGATMHYMDNHIDTGDVIFQMKKSLSDDLDLGLLYFLALNLEVEVFEKGWALLKKREFKYVGKKQKGLGSWFNRTEELQRIDFQKMEDDLLYRTIKSFGILGQGSLGIIDGELYQIYEAQKINNEVLLNTFKDKHPGKIVHVYDQKLLVKTKNGVMKITRFSLVK